jgi:hypothetical protein
MGFIKTKMEHAIKIVKKMDNLGIIMEFVFKIYQIAKNK